MEFRILGPLEVIAEGRPLELGGPKQRALLAALLLEANRVVPADRLIAALWEDGTPETAAKALQVYVSQLRKLLGRERLETRSPGYLLRVQPGELDAQRFERLHAEGRLAEALALWRGAVLADFTYQRFAQAEADRLEELQLACLEQRIEDDLDGGRHREVVGELEALLRAHPLRERLRAQLMLALYRAGRQGDALEAYQAGRRALVDGLGIEPSRELRELHQAILNQSVGLDLAPPDEPAAEEARGVFVGRERELAALRAGLDDAFAGRGRLFLLAGEPGIGKSRLADEVIREARSRGAQVLVGRCWEAGGAPAYWPWVQSLRTYIRDASPPLLREQLGPGAPHVAQILPELRELLPGLPEPPPLESDSARFRLFDATAEFLRRASGQRPIVLVLDDLHAADTPSLLLVQYVARELEGMRVLLVGALRDVDPVPGRAVGELLAALARERTTRRLTLGGLNAHDVAEYVERSAAELASPELLTALYEETEGNPLFVSEMVRLLALERPGAGLTIPQSIRDVISRRLAHLSADCRRVLVLASVLGREFALDALARMAGLANDELLDTLDEAMLARVVGDVPGARGRLRFAHVLIRDTLYEELTTAGRVRLHRLAVEALEALHANEPEAHLAELAHHAIGASEFRKGVDYARRAGDRALVLLAYEEAARQYATALDALELAAPSDEPVRCELLLALGEATMRAGDAPAAKGSFLQAAEIARRLKLPRELARAAAGYGGRIVWGRAGEDAQLVPLLEEAIAVLPPDDVDLLVRLLGRLAGALRDEPSRDRRDALTREALELARRSGNLAALAYALDARGYAILAPDTVDEALALGDELRAIALQAGDPERIVAGHMLRSIALHTRGRIDEAEAGITEAMQTARDLQQPAQLWQINGDRSMLALAKGRLDEAESLITETFAFGERALRGSMPIHRTHRWMLADFRGRLEEVEAEIRDLAAESPARPVFRCVLAHLLARRGEPAEAKALVRELAADGCAALPFDQEWLLAMSLLAETAALVEDADAAAAIYPVLAPWASFHAVDVAEGARGSIERYLGQLSAALGRLDEAVEHFEAALAENERAGLRPWLAYTQADYAGVLRSRRAPGDPERAEQLLSEALAAFAELGMAVPAAQLA